MFYLIGPARSTAKRLAEQLSLMYDGLVASIGNELIFRVYSRRWNHEDTYHFTLTEHGWNIRFGTRVEACEPSGNPFLFRNLDQDFVGHLVRLGTALEQMHEHHDGHTDEELQVAFNNLAGWVSAAERNTPVQGMLEGLL